MPRSPSPITAHEVESVVATLSYRGPAPTQVSTTAKKKGSTSKTKMETKNKEFPFTFESSEENYLSFLSTILKKHGYDKYVPVVKDHKFGIKYGIAAKKLKKDAIDLDRLSEYVELTKKILEEQPLKLTVFINLEDVKTAYKRPIGNAAADSSSDEASNDENDDDGKNTIDRELGRLRGILERKYQNPADSGYTFVTNDGEKMPLTPAMMSEWVRAMYDGLATAHNPPNTQAFDPKMRARSLFQTPKTSGSGNEGILQSISSIMHDARAIFTGDTRISTHPPVTPSNARPIPNDFSSTTSTSPPKPSPSKLPTFLKYAEEMLGVKNATNYEFSLEEKGYGPDVLQFVKDEDIVSCGVSAGDAIRLKRGAEKWWASPEAKRARIDGPTFGSPVTEERHISIRFEKRFHEGGSHSVFGSKMVVGDNAHADEYTWWYYNQFTRRLEKIPDGMVPELDDEYIPEEDRLFST